MRVNVSSKRTIFAPQIVHIPVIGWVNPNTLLSRSRTIRITVAQKAQRLSVPNPHGKKSVSCTLSPMALLEFAPTAAWTGIVAPGFGEGLLQLRFLGCQHEHHLC